MCTCMCVSTSQSEVVGHLEGAMESTVDAQQWRLEVERVLPSLRVHFRQDNRVSDTLYIHVHVQCHV